MRKFKARWWVEDPTAHYQNACDSVDGPGIAVRYINSASASDLVAWLECMRATSGQ